MSTFDNNKSKRKPNPRSMSLELFPSPILNWLDCSNYPYFFSWWESNIFSNSLPHIKRVFKDYDQLPHTSLLYFQIPLLHPIWSWWLTYSAKYSKPPCNQLSISLHYLFFHYWFGRAFFSGTDKRRRTHINSARRIYMQASMLVINGRHFSTCHPFMMYMPMKQLCFSIYVGN